ncbi:MAG: hypothetical protein KIC98_04160 [Clostridioides difficile]|nr:hypothetical protein [Clostridioides difficile]
MDLFNGHEIKTKSYDLLIDFKDYKMNKDIVDGIVFDEYDNQTAIIKAKLIMGGEDIDLTPYDWVAIEIATADGRKIMDKCLVVDPLEGLIEIRLNKQSLLTSGFSRFKISLVKSSSTLVSPKFYYRVDEAIISEHDVKASDEYNIFMVLIARTEKLLDDVRVFHDKLIELDEMLKENERIRNEQEVAREVAEGIRNDKEDIRKANENIRQEQEAAREVSIANMQIQVDNKLEEMVNHLNTSIDNKYKEIDTTIENRFTYIKTELDQKVVDKFTEVDNKINFSIDTMNNKISEVDTNTNAAIKRVDDKITEVDTSKNQMEEDVRIAISNIKDGIDGKDGVGIQIKGVLNSVEELPVDPILSDAYCIGKSLYAWNDEEWFIVEDITGAGLEFNWSGTQLGIRIEGQIDYTYVDLKGAKGDQGIQGIQGEKGNQGIQGTQGEQGYQGIKGDQGDKGDPGLDGHTYHIEIGENENWFIEGEDTGLPSRGLKGDKGDQGLQGIQGDKGDTGDKGDPGNGLIILAFVNSEEELPDSPNIGDAYLVGINLYIYLKDGWKNCGELAGLDGKSAYNIAIENGFTGSESEWIESLKGKNGDPGISAYQVAVNDGFTGTESEWLDSFKGLDGTFNPIVEFDELNTEHKTVIGAINEIDTCIKLIPKNPAFDKLILESDWTQDNDGNYIFEIDHDLNTERVFINAIDNTTKDGVLIGYTVVDKTKIIVKLISPIEVFVTIINGDNKNHTSINSDTRKLIIFDKEVHTNDWVVEDELAACIIHHKLFTEKVFVSAIETKTKQSLQIEYEIIDDVSIKAFISNPQDALVTILNGEKEFIDSETESEINDNTISTGTTWSSERMNEKETELKNSIKEIKTLAEETSRLSNETREMVDSNSTDIGDTKLLNTSSKDNLVSAINDVITYATNLNNIVEEQQVIIDRLVSEVNTLTTEIDGQRLKAIELANSLESKL